MEYEILTASKDHSEDAVRKGIATTRPDLTIEDLKLVDNKWHIMATVKEGEKPPFLQDAPSDDAPAEGSPEEEATETPDEEKAEDKKDDKSDSKDKGKDGDKPSGDVVSELKDLMTQLQDVIKQVSDKAGDAVAETEEHRKKLDEAKDALGDGEGGPGPLGDAPAPPMPDEAGLGDGPPGLPKGPPVPRGPRAPGARPRPGRPGVPGGGPGIQPFTHVEVAEHPGTNEKGERISLVAAAADLESDPEFAEYEVVGMVENSDGTYSAKLKKKV